MAPSVEKKIAELEMGLLHLQQNIEIPEISLLIHPIITNIAKQSYERGDKPKVQDFGDKVEDPTFLNQLQSGVNRWIREIQKVQNQRECVERDSSLVLDLKIVFIHSFFSTFQKCISVYVIVCTFLPQYMAIKKTLLILRGRGKFL